MLEPVTLGRPAGPYAPVPHALGAGAVLIAAGLFLVLAAVRGDGLGFGTAALPLYCLGLLYIGVLAWWESTGTRAGVLPLWASPPAFIAGWTLVWIYAPGLGAFLDNSLLDDFAAAQGGEALLLTGLLLTCVALTTLSCSYHATTLALGRRARTVVDADRPVGLQRVVGLYLVSAAARVVRVIALGIAFGADRSAWGPLQSIDQWIGYVEDLRFLALALLVTHVVRRGTGRLWLWVPIVLEAVFAATSGFLTPFFLPVIVCVATVAAFGRLTGRHLVLIAATIVVVSTFVPVVAAIRQDRTGEIGTSYRDGVGGALAGLGAAWLDGLASSQNSAYQKFFGRQAEVASATGLVMALTPAVVPFEGLEQFLTLPANLIPRALWPDKPTLSRGLWFSATFRGQDSDTTSYSAMTLFSEGYLFFGWTGTVLAMLLIGAVLAVLHRGLDTPGLAVVYLALVPTIIHVELHLSSYLTALVQRSLVFAAVFLVLTHTRSLAQPRVRT